MTSLSQKNAQRFDGLRDQQLAGLKKVNAARREASAAGRFDEENQLIAQRTALRHSLLDIDKAEDAYIRSSLSVGEAENLLKKASSDARDAVEKMVKIAETIKKAAELIGLLTKLASLFP